MSTEKIHFKIGLSGTYWDKKPHYTISIDNKEYVNAHITKESDATEYVEFDCEVEEEAEWKKHWQGMPEYKQEDNPTYKTIYVHFRNKEDYEEFAKLIDQNLSEKTKSIWHPKLDRTENALLRWIVE